MPISDVKIIFKNPWSIKLFTELVNKDIKPQLAFEWIYKHIQGNCIKKDLEFETIIQEQFGVKKLNELLGLVQSSQVSQANAKDIMMRIIDGQ